VVQSSPNGRVRSAFGQVFRAVGPVALIAMALAAGASLSAAATKTETTFGSWAVVCLEPDNQPKSCSMMQSHVATDKQTNKKRMVLRWAISLNNNREQRQALMVPVGVSIKEGVRLFLGDAQPIVIGYSFCGPRMCVASALLDAKFIAAIKASKKASASYVLGSKQLVQVPLNLNGFGEAYDFLVQQLS
jgi:invasion protein IalB